MNPRTIYISRVLLTLVFVLVPLGALALTGGPDGGGYTFTDSTEAGGPAYAFEDIAHISNSLNMPYDDNAKAAFIGFDFRFYGSVYNTVNVSSNGHIDFTEGYGNGSYNLNNSPIPQPSNYGPPNDTGWGLNPLVAVFFDDLDPADALAEVYADVRGSAGDRRFIVQWDSMPHAECISTPGDRINDLTFQAILYEATGEMLFRYKDVTTDNSTTVCTETTGGASATVGLDFNDIVGLQYSANTAALSNGLAILFSPGTDPAIVPSATSIDFGTVSVGDTAAVVLKLSNTGGGLLTINSTTGMPLVAFDVLGDNCTGTDLLVGESCLMSVVYSPSEETASIGNLIINSTDPNYPPASPLIIDLTGSGTLSLSGPDIFVLDPIVPYNDLRAEMAPVDLFTNTSAIFTVINNGTSALVINSVTAMPFPFSISSEGCTGVSPLAAGASCDIDLGFKPTTADNYTGELVIVSDDPDESPLKAYASITANYALVANITASAPSFANTLVFNTTTETVTVGNNGTGDLSITSVLLGSPVAYSGYFAINLNGCLGATLTPGSTCAIDLDFTPGAVVNGATAWLSIASNDPDESPLSITLTGNGLSNPPTAPVLLYPTAGAKDIPRDVFFKWEHSTDPDPGDMVTYLHYYTTKADYDLNSFAGVTPFGPISKASGGNGAMYAAVSAPAFAFLMAMVLAGPMMDRRRRLLLGLVVLAALAMALMACGNGLFDDSYQLGIEPWAGHQVNGLTNSTEYAWKVVAQDNHGETAQSPVWFFTTAP